MGDRRCCCTTAECVDEEDNFNRADSIDPGSLWYEDLGDWQIVGFQLVEVSGTPNSKIFCTTELPARSAGEMTVSIKVYNSQNGDKYHIYPACTALGTVGPVKVEFERLDDTYWKVTIIGSGCTDYTIIQAAAFDAFGGVGLGVCVDADDGVGMISAEITAQPGYPGVWCDDDDAGLGRFCAFGHGNSHASYFDDFAFTELRMSEHPRDKSMECENCWCWCLDMVPDRHLTASFRDSYFVEEGGPTDCTRANCLDQSWDMDWEYNAGLPRWYGEVTVPATANGGLETDLAFYLTCSEANDDTTPGANFALFFDTGSGAHCTSANTNGDGPYYPIAELSTCEPFSLLFGPFYLTWSELDCPLCWGPGAPTTGSDSCGRYYILVTGG